MASGVDLDSFGTFLKLYNLQLYIDITVDKDNAEKINVTAKVDPEKIFYGISEIEFRNWDLRINNNFVIDVLLSRDRDPACCSGPILNLFELLYTKVLKGRTVFSRLKVRSDFFSWSDKQVLDTIQELRELLSNDVHAKAISIVPTKDTVIVAVEATEDPKAVQSTEDSKAVQSAEVPEVPQAVQVSEVSQAAQVTHHDFTRFVDTDMDLKYLLNTKHKNGRIESTTKFAYGDIILDYEEGIPCIYQYDNWTLYTVTRMDCRASAVRRDNPSTRPRRLYESIFKELEALPEDIDYDLTIPIQASSLTKEGELNRVLEQIASLLKNRVPYGEVYLDPDIDEKSHKIVVCTETMQAVQENRKNEVDEFLLKLGSSFLASVRGKSAEDKDIASKVMEDLSKEGIKIRLQEGDDEDDTVHRNKHLIATDLTSLDEMEMTV